jgi:ribosomal protein S18 acetylase RimI-like enzyme
MVEEMPHIEVRALQIDDAPALYELDYSFETDCVYTLQICDQLVQNDHNSPYPANSNGNRLSSFALKLVETPVDPPIYKNYREAGESIAALEARLRASEGGFVALANGEVAGCILLSVEEWRSVTQVEDLMVGHQFRRYGVGSLLLNCAADWARNRKCWAVVLETQSHNYPALQFYLRNGLEVWSINQNYYPPGPYAHEVAIFMGKRLSATPED